MKEVAPSPALAARGWGTWAREQWADFMSPGPEDLGHPSLAEDRLEHGEVHKVHIRIGIELGVVEVV